MITVTPRYMYFECIDYQIKINFRQKVDGFFFNPYHWLFFTGGGLIIISVIINCTMYCNIYVQKGGDGLQHQMEVIKETFSAEIGYNVWNVLHIEDLLVTNHPLTKEFTIKK